MIKFIKQLFCKHDYKTIDGGYEYSFRLIKDNVCIKCGKIKEEE